MQRMWITQTNTDQGKPITLPNFQTHSIVMKTQSVLVSRLTSTAREQSGCQQLVHVTTLILKKVQSYTRGTTFSLREGGTLDVCKGKEPFTKADRKWIPSRDQRFGAVTRDACLP